MKKTLIILLIIILLSILILKIFNIKGYILKKIYPIKYSEYVEKYSEECNLDPLLVYAIIKAESNFNTNVKSRSNAIGLMQLMPTTAEELETELLIQISEEKLYDPEINIMFGTKYFSKLITSYKGNINLAIIAYNAGIGNVNNWLEKGIIKSDGTDIENVPFKETNNYIRKILRDYEIYKTLYNK